MSSLLAQANLPAEQLKIWFEVLFFLVGGTAAIVGLLVGLKALRASNALTLAPQPLDVREAPLFATKPELNALENRLGAEIHQLHGHVSGVRSELGEKIDAIDARIDEIPHRVIQLLKETKEYHQK